MTEKTYSKEKILKLNKGIRIVQADSAISRLLDDAQLQLYSSVNCSN